MGERYVAVEVKLATNQLTLIVWIISVACLVGWLLRQTITKLRSSQHGGFVVPEPGESAQPGAHPEEVLLHPKS